MKIGTCIFKKKARPFNAQGGFWGPSNNLFLYLGAITQVWSVYEHVGAGRIASPIDNKTTGGKESQCPVFTLIKISEVLLMISRGCHLYLMYFLILSDLKR